MENDTEHKWGFVEKDLPDVCVNRMCCQMACAKWSRNPQFLEAQVLQRPRCRQVAADFGSMAASAHKRFRSAGS